MPAPIPIENYTLTEAGTINVPNPADKEVLYVSSNVGYFYFAGTEGKEYTIRAEIIDTQPVFQRFNIYISVWYPGNYSPEPDLFVEPGSDSEPYEAPFDFDLQNGAKVVFTAPSTGNYKVRFGGLPS